MFVRDLHPHLRSIEGGRAAAAPVEEIHISRSADRGERNEPWTLAVTESLVDLEQEAAANGMDLGHAVRLVAEAALAGEELQALGIALEPLDVAAAGATVSDALDACQAAYVRRLTTAVARSPRILDALFIAALPTRLSTRLLAADLPALLDGTSLARACAWEIAAVLSGRTISEWAPMTALTQLTR